jgi:hypothetical protein
MDIARYQVNSSVCLNSLSDHGQERIRTILTGRLLIKSMCQCLPSE